MERNIKIERAIQRSIKQLEVAMQSIYSDSNTALKLMEQAKENIDIGAIALHIHIDTQ